ncbi:MAG: TusE/DsrC/DsvC family sulfur relay protein, partial [bacterium]
IRRLKKSGGIPTKELYELFPNGPAKKAARIAGLPKPKGCV